MVNKSQNVRYLDHTQPLEARINDLISRMTLEEKISQVINDAEENIIGGVKLFME